MADLKLTVKDLVDAATSDVDPKELRPKVEAMLDAFDGASAAAQLAAVKSIGTALGKVDGRGAQVLALALGALVEEGASAEAAWPAAAKGLGAILEQATAFAHAVVSASGNDDLEAALESHGAKVAAKMKREGAAWKTMGARCLAAVACLARSKAVRARARKDKSLAEAAWSLSDAVGEVGALLQALCILDDATIIVLDPVAKKGWKLGVDALSSNAELYLLVADVLDLKVDAKVISAVRAGETPKKKSVELPFTLGIDPEELPSEIAIPSASKDRIVILRAGKTKIETEHLPVLEGLCPDARLEGALPAAAVAKLSPAFGGSRNLRSKK